MSFSSLIIKKLHNDISLLLFPSKERALKLNKAYKVLVKEQSYIYGKDANDKSINNVYKEVKEAQPTNITKLIVK